MLMSEVNKTNAAIIVLKYKDAEIISFTGIRCTFTPDDMISICTEYSTIQFKCINKVINFKISIDKTFANTPWVGVVINIVDKGSKVV